MARRRGGFSRGGIRPPQRQIGNFAATGEIDGLTSVIGVAKAVYSVGIATLLDALTIVRTRGELSVRIAAAAAGNTIMRGAMGIILVSSDAFGIGVTAVPGPLSDSGADWYVWVPFTLAFDDVIANNDSVYVAHVPFDSRGMRKSKGGDVSAIVLEVEADLAGNSIDSSFILREQFKL